MIAKSAKAADGAEWYHPGGRLCQIWKTEKDSYVGNWMFGDTTTVKFPKGTTRKLTVGEKKDWNGQKIVINGSVFKLTFRC